MFWDLAFDRLAKHTNLRHLQILVHLMQTYSGALICRGFRIGENIISVEQTKD